MIRVSRGKEPLGLRRARTKTRLPRAIAAYNVHGAPSEELTKTLVAYSSWATKTALFLAQHKKCVWCERRRDLSSSPVEHYRPKNGAWRHERGQAQRVDPAHYWWLTWTWEDMFFSCARCNDQRHKANFFPLCKRTKSMGAPVAPVSNPLPDKHFVTEKEEPLLLDPARDDHDPLDHIEWKPVDASAPREDWLWSPKALTEEGRVTILVLRLEELGDEAADYLRLVVLRGVKEVEQHLSDKRKTRARARWDTLLSDVLRPEASFSSVAYWALKLWAPAGFREPPRPGLPPRARVS